METSIMKTPTAFENGKSGGSGMKLVVAYVQPEQLPYVKQALYESEITKMSITNALGCGQQKGFHESYRGVDIEVNLLKKVRIEIAVTEPYLQATIDAIIKGAKTGAIGDGKIFVMELAQCIRIRTSEIGAVAIG